MKGWKKEKPTFTEDCILLTATKIEAVLEYKAYQVLWVDYWAWCEMDGEEVGDITYLQADYYQTIKLI
jgi:hypothetical protein